MLSKLQYILSTELGNLLNDPERWDSLLINRRKPHTYRVFTEFKDPDPEYNGLRICLHKFDACATHEAFEHPHPWPGAFVILDGSYKMRFGQSVDRFSKPIHMETIKLTKYSMYDITDPLTWHSVIPLRETYTIMVNDKPWSADVAHTEVRTTKGKDLDKMPDQELREFLWHFQGLLKQWKEYEKIDN